jgi:hypothetical protein
MAIIMAPDKDLLPRIQHYFPGVPSYKLLRTVVQDNAFGFLIETDEGQGLFIKTVDAEDYSHKAWPDLRRTLLYARTEVRFYNETLPKLKVFKDMAPVCYVANCNLEGLVSETDRAVDVSNVDPEGDLKGKGGFIILRLISSDHYFQDSPLSQAQVRQSLQAAAKLHAMAWENVDILEVASNRLSRGSYHLQLRAPKELQGILQAWDNFVFHFKDYAPDLFAKTSVLQLGHRIKRVAEKVSQQLSPGPHDPYATLVHGDYKAMNVFLPKDDSSDRNAIMIDFASTGVGLGMNDVAMHIYHALHPSDIDEDALLEHYLRELWLARKQCHPNPAPYPKEVALRHFRWAVIDYFRFFLGRFWKSATLESMQKKKDSKNTNLINRDPDAAMAFVATVDRFLTEYEQEMGSN